MAELSIKLRIGNREYPMKVKAEDEAMIRQAGKKINEQMKAYQEKFGIDDKQDLLAMVAFDSVVDKHRTLDRLDAEDNLSQEQVQRLNQLVSQAL